MLLLLQSYLEFWMPVLFVFPISESRDKSTSKRTKLEGEWHRFKSNPKTLLFHSNNRLLGMAAIICQINSYRRLCMWGIWSAVLPMARFMICSSRLAPCSLFTSAEISAPRVLLDTPMSITALLIMVCLQYFVFFCFCFKYLYFFGFKYLHVLLNNWNSICP